MLAQLAGSWKVQMLDPGWTHDEVTCRDDYYILTGGTTTHHVKNAHGTHPVVVPNQPFQDTFHFYRGPNGELYFDYTGSLLTKLDFENGEVELNAANNQRKLLQRSWKRDGLSPPQQAMTGTMPVVIATVVGAGAEATASGHTNQA